MSAGGTRTETIRETSNSEPWIGAQPALAQALGQAQQAFGRGPAPFFPGDTVADMNDFTLQGAGQIAGNAGASRDLAGAGMETLFDTMDMGPLAGGGFMAETAGGGRRNPFLDNIASASGRATNPSGLDNFAAGGRGNNFLDAILAAGGRGVDTSALDPFVTNGGVNPNAGALGGTGAAGDFLTSMMNAEPGGNPQLDAMFKRGSGQIDTALRESFAKAGRGGGSINFADALGENLADFGADLYGGAYEGDQNRRLGAGGALAGLEEAGRDRMFSMGESALGRQFDAASLMPAYHESGLNRALGAAEIAGGFDEQGLSRQLSASGALANLSAGDIDRLLSGAGMGADVASDDMGRAIEAFLGLSSAENARAGLGLNAAGMLPDMFHFGNQGARDLLNLGDMFQGQEQSEIDANVARHNYNENSDTQMIEWLNAIASGQGSLGGSRTTNSQTPVQRGNPWASAASAAAAAASIAAMFSDERLKTDIEPIGADRDGVLWHRFRYLTDAPGTERVGVMAAELEAIAPHLVKTGPGGFKMVDYSGLEHWSGR